MTSISKPDKVTRTTTGQSENRVTDESGTRSSTHLLWTVVLFLVLILVVAFWLWYWVNFPKIIPQENWESFAQFGGAFTPLSALFSALAFWGLIVTISLQIRQIREQERKMVRTGELQRQIANALVSQAVMNERATKLAALNSLIGILDSKLATANDQEKHFLQLELAQAIGDLRILVGDWKIESKLVQDRPLSQRDVEELLPEFDSGLSITLLNGPALWCSRQAAHTRFSMQPTITRL